MVTKRLKGALGGALLLLTLAVTGCGSQSPNQPVQVPVNAQKVHVYASNFKWTLDKTKFVAGRPIDFVVQSTESIHGFNIAGTKISQVIAQGQKPIDVIWTPPKPGRYTIRCDKYCGTGHYNMFTSFTVVKS